MERPIQVIDGGGNGFRRADVYGKEVKNLVTTQKPSDIQAPSQLLRFVCDKLPKDCLGIAYAMAGEIDRQGIVVKSPQIHMLDGFPLRKSTEKQSRKPVLVVNDMDGAAIGIRTLMTPACDYFAAITWSSGIGLRVYKNGEILAPCEGGHIPLDLSPFAPLCGCGLRGCVESICGGESVKRRVLAETEALGIEIPKRTHPCAFLDDCFKRFVGRDYVERIPNKWAYEIYDLVAKAMGTCLASLQGLLRLPLVVWKGSFASHAIPLIDQMIRTYMREKLSNKSWEREMRFIFSPDPEKDSLIGAAVLFQKEYKTG